MLKRIERAIEEVTRDILTMSKKEFEEALEEAKDDPRYEDILDIIERKQY